jgi:hypothetical protein
MSDEDDRFIFILCLALSPNELEGKVFFNRSDLYLDSSNEFYEIGEVRNEFFVIQSIVIGGQQRRVKYIIKFRFSPVGRRQEAIQRAMISQACVIS